MKWNDLNILQILDTQLATCRKAAADAGNDAAEEEVIPRWDPSHLDLRHRFSSWVTHTSVIAALCRWCL